MLRPGEAFEDFVVDGVLGHGGTSTVYRAHVNTNPAHPMALKVLADDRRGDVEIARLQREFEFPQRLRHPHVISVERHGDGWLAMQLVDGGTVATLDSLDDRLQALAQIAEALDFAHQRGIVHSDVKPSNILVFEDFSRAGAVLTDFAVAHAVAEDFRKRPQPLQASLPYLAPEVLRGRAPAAATDQYALACTAVELVTGSPPFAADTPAELATAHLQQPPPYLSRTVSWLPRAFDGVAGKALAKDPELRYPTCADFVAAISRVLG